MGLSPPPPLLWRGVGAEGAEKILRYKFGRLADFPAPGVIPPSPLVMAGGQMVEITRLFLSNTVDVQELRRRRPQVIRRSQLTGIRDLVPVYGRRVNFLLVAGCDFTELDLGSCWELEGE